MVIFLMVVDLRSLRVVDDLFFLKKWCECDFREEKRVDR